MVGIQCSMQHFKFMYFLHFHCYFYVARSWKAERSCWQNIEWNLGKSYQLIIWIWNISKAENCLYVFPSNFGTLGPSRFRFNHTLSSSTRKKTHFSFRFEYFALFNLCMQQADCTKTSSYMSSTTNTHESGFLYARNTYTPMRRWLLLHAYVCVGWIHFQLSHSHNASCYHRRRWSTYFTIYTHTHANTHTHAHPRSTALLCTNTGQNKQNKHTYDNYTNTMNEIATPKHWQCRNTQWRNKKREKRRNKKRREKKMKHK